MRASLAMILAICVWVLASVAVLAWLGQQQLKSFDPDGRLIVASMSADFDHQVQQVFAGFHADLANRAFHIQAPHCACNLSNDRHIAELNQAMSAVGFEDDKIDARRISDDLPLSHFPAIAVFGPNGRLRYLGPYASGMLCAGDNRIVDRYLPLFNQAGQHPIIVTDSQGCYCQAAA